MLLEHELWVPLSSAVKCVAGRAWLRLKWGKWDFFLFKIERVSCSTYFYYASATFNSSRSIFIQQFKIAQYHSVSRRWKKVLIQLSRRDTQMITLGKTCHFQLDWSILSWPRPTNGLYSNVRLRVYFRIPPLCALALRLWHMKKLTF